MNSTTKVGIMTLLASALLAYMVFIIGDFSLGERGYEFIISFYSVDGLSKGASVAMSGVRIGKVSNIEIRDDQVYVYVVLKDGDLKIRRKSTFTITTAGLMGEKYVEIKPTRDYTSPYVTANEVVAGTDPTRMDELFEQGNMLIVKLRELTDAAKDIFDDPELKDNTKLIFKNAKVATDRLNDILSAVKDKTESIVDGLDSILARIDEQIGANADDLREMVKNFRTFANDLAKISNENKEELSEIVTNINKATGRLDKMIENLDKDGKLTDDLKATVESVRLASGDAAEITAEVKELIADKEIRQKINRGLDDAHKLAQAVDKVFLNIRQTKIDFKYLLRYNKDADDFLSDIIVDLYPNEKTFYRMGVEDVGGEDSFTMMVARGADSKLIKRGGIVSSKIGLGFDYLLAQEIALSLDLIDVPDSEFRIKAGYKMSDNVRFELRIDDITDKKDVNFGFEYKF